MNEKFFELSNEKQLRIITAGLEVFGKNEYKRAVTDDIAIKAGVSKGLLFYYFHNKKSFYLYLYQYCTKLLKKTVMDKEFSEITDFFELLEHGADAKVEILTAHPYINEFVMRAFYSQNEDISTVVSESTRAGLNESFSLYFSNINFTKFKEGVEPAEIYRMLVWMTDGYLHEKQSFGQPLDLEDIMEEYHKWKKMFRKMAYKEEWL